MSTVIRNGRVIDPSTGTDEIIDVFLEGDRVVDAPEVIAPGTDEIDASGMLVLPGFVDVHTHSDFTIAEEPQALARIHQGVTTDVTGNCGFSPFPLPVGRTEFGSFFGGSQVEGHPDLDAYVDHLAGVGPAVNIAPLVGLGSVRHQVLGDASRRPTSSELTQMQDHVTRAMEQGAFGASSGLVYVPGVYASTAELREVLRPIGRARALYATHLRDERDGLVPAVEEAISVAEDVGANLQISHHKALGSENWGATEKTLKLVDEANARGLIEVAVDYYPYTAGSTGIASLMPPTALDEGWPALRERLSDSVFRGSVLEHLNEAAQFRPTEVVIGRSRTWPGASGRSVEDLARRDGVSPAEVLLQLIQSEGERLTIVVPAASETDLRSVMSHHRAMHGSDAWLMSKEQARYEHPRNLGSAVRVLVSAITGGTTLTRAVEHLAVLPARRLGLIGRGTLEPGAYADLLVVDPSRATAQEDRVNAFDYPDLMRWVFINGEPVIAAGKATGRRPGRTLRST